jgi:hypothetical protein
MRVFKTRWFARFAKREDISDDHLADAIARPNAVLSTPTSAAA